MEANINLYGELCSALSIDTNKQSAIWDILKKYDVRAIAGFESFNNCFDRFITAKKCENISSITLTNYMSSLKMFKSYINDVCPSNIDVNMIRNYILYLKDKNLNESSIAQNVGRIRVFFNWLEKENLIINNPMNQIKAIKANMDTRTALTDKEVDNLRNHCYNNVEKSLFEFFISTGCRLAEVSNLHVKDIDFNFRSAVVTGKGNKTREVLFSNKASSYLSSIITSTTDIVFTNSNYVNNRAFIYNTIKDIGNRCNMNIYPHLLRHTFATNALRNGMNITIIQILMGHEDVSTTQIYAKTDKSMLQKEYNKYMLD